MPVRDGADLGADALDRVDLRSGEGGPFLVDLGDAVEPVLVELVAHVAFEEGLARDAVALGEAQHLAAERGQAAVVAVELLDQIFDLAAVELDALDLGGEVLAELLILLLVGDREIVAGGQRVHAAALDLGEFLEDRGDLRELLERLRLQRLFHLGEGEGVVLVLFLRLRPLATLDHVLVVFVGVARRARRRPLPLP